jgi:signal transduction histidine kinase
MPDIGHILERIERKLSDYAHYRFSERENDALKTFFDLSQEFDDLGDFYKLCVSIPRGVFGLHARLYIADPKDKRLALAAASDPSDAPLSSPEDMTPPERPVRTPEGSLLLPVRGNLSIIDRLAFDTDGGVLGLFEVYPSRDLSEGTEFFLEKFVNRIGYNLHNRFIVRKNVEHLRFIRSLVMDIEHNVITPNMVYKLYLRNLTGKIVKNRQIEAMLDDYLRTEGAPAREDIERFLAELHEVNGGLATELENIDRHYKNMSLFLETLLRRGHFDHGRLMLRTKSCNIKRDVLEPQIAQYRERFARLGIAIEDRLSGVPDEDVLGVVDVGLIAQVYSNLFSNALKYARPVASESGETLKYISYGRQIVPGHFGPGRDGVKYNVFSTGPHVNPAETRNIFEEGYRCSDMMDRPGTGHGLAFVRNVLEMHGGEAGYEATRYGNNFYFILPL